MSEYTDAPDQSVFDHASPTPPSAAGVSRREFVHTAARNSLAASAATALPWAPPPSAPDRGPGRAGDVVPDGGGSRAHDVVIVGGGTAGSVLAARLSEDPTRRVLLLEAGPDYPVGQLPPNLYSSYSVGGDAQHDWGLKSQPGVVGHPINLLRGKLVGGSSAVNAAVAARGLPGDYDRWAAMGNPGWAWADVLPTFRRMEDDPEGVRLHPEAHGAGGPFLVRRYARERVTPLMRAFLDASVAAGFREVPDHNGPNPEGVARYGMNVVNGVRENVAMMYLGPAVRARRNLEVRGGALVDRVVFNGQRATGVRLATGEVVPAGTVILASGTYESPAVLIRSGVGPAADLGALGVPVVRDLPVGRTLYDQPFFYHALAVDKAPPEATQPPVGVILWTRSSEAAPGELDLHISATHLGDPSMSPTGAMFVLGVALVRPESRGTLRLASREPGAAPVIDLNFLSDPRDRRRMIEGVRLSRRVAAEAPLAQLVRAELSPGAAATTDAGIERALMTTLDTYHHPVGTARMGPAADPLAVVGADGRVHGTDALYVIDASIMPDGPSHATNLTTAMIAEHLAARMTSGGPAAGDAPGSRQRMPRRGAET